MKLSLLSVFCRGSILTVLLFSGSIFASPAQQQGQQIEIHTSDLNATPINIRSASLRSLLKYKWEITSVQKNKIVAHYREANVVLNFTHDNNIKLSMSGGRAKHQLKWLNNIKHSINEELKFHFYMLQFHMGNTH